LLTRDARRGFGYHAIALALGDMKSVCAGVLRRLGESAALRRLGHAIRLLFAHLIVTVRRRSLISEILALQILVAVVAGGLAFGGLWWASSLALRDHMQTWGARWLDSLDQLAAPRYVANEAARNAQARMYLEQFSEILFVRYYSPAGETIAEELPEPGRDAPVAPFDARRLESLASSKQSHLLDTVLGELPVVRVAQPIWQRSMPVEKLLGLDQKAAEETLAGYVELGLDFSSYRAYEIRGILRSVAIGVLLLLALTTASWAIYRRALLPLSALQIPAKRLAHGQTDFDVTASGHREIVAVANALKATASALGERDVKLSRLASRDTLTGLLNRSTFNALLAGEMESVAASGRTGALLYADLDQFKYVNDSLGVVAGDRIIKLVADWLCANLRPGDIVARFAGDAFGVLLQDVSNKEVAAIGTELVKAMQSASFVDGDRAVSIRCSIGATMIRGTRVEPAKLVNRAERASYQAKLNGRNQFCFYNFASRESAEMTADAGWSQKIQKALKEDAFVLHYQPIVNLRTRATAYYEVLLRMAFDDEELAFPATFLPTAARLGLMVDIDRWVIRQALRSLAALRFVHGDVRFTLNVSGSTFDRPDFFSYLETELRFAGIPLDAIVIEITEQTAMRNLSGVASRMGDLAARGCRFAIDDFGSGYCSYSYLKNLPLSFVKIDGSFIANLAKNKVDQTIVAAIAEVAAVADCETIAEHVTDYETLQLLDKLGVAYAQGYFLGKPAPQLAPTTLPLPLATANRRLAPRRADAPRTRRVARRKVSVSGAPVDTSDESSYL
jgi:diguanylate cyclase (GGDEF)-like protein